jgi:hypothetical protein
MYLNTAGIALYAPQHDRDAALSYCLESDTGIICPCAAL